MSSNPPAASEPRSPREPAGQDLSRSVFCLSLRAGAEIGVMARVVQALARRSLLPRSWHGTAAGEVLLVDLQIAGLSEAEGELLAAALAQIVGVEEVLTSRAAIRDAA
jgi:hypothetical protein